MHGPEHYLTKIERNANVIDKAPAHERATYIANIKWARDLADRLQNLDYMERDKSIAEIHRVIDADYAAMGFGPTVEASGLGK